MILLHEYSEKSVCLPMKAGDRTKMKGNRPSLHRESIPIRSNKNPSARQLSRRRGEKTAFAQFKLEASHRVLQSSNGSKQSIRAPY